MTAQIMVIQILLSFYQKRKFKITEILVGGQLQFSRTDLAKLEINLNCVSVDDHVPEAKRLIWTLNERCRCSMYNTPFLKLPNCIVFELLQIVTFYPDAFPHADKNVSKLSPLTFVQGRSKTQFIMKPWGLWDPNKNLWQ